MKMCTRLSHAFDQNVCKLSEQRRVRSDHTSFAKNQTHVVRVERAASHRTASVDFRPDRGRDSGHSAKSGRSRQPGPVAHLHDWRFLFYFYVHRIQHFADRSLFAIYPHEAGLQVRGVVSRTQKHVGYCSTLYFRQVY